MRVKKAADIMPPHLNPLPPGERKIKGSGLHRGDEGGFGWFDQTMKQRLTEMNRSMAQMLEQDIQLVLDAEVRPLLHARGGVVSFVVVHDRADIGVVRQIVVGDLALAFRPDGTALPGVAQVAMQQGAYAARAIVNRLGRQVSEDIAAFKFNTGLAKMMEALNDLKPELEPAVPSQVQPAAAPVMPPLSEVLAGYSPMPQAALFLTNGT